MLQHSVVPKEDRMNVRKNAPMTPGGREAMVRAVVDGVMSPAAAARRFKTIIRIVNSAAVLRSVNDRA